jgi:hypothetical protein
LKKYSKKENVLDLLYTGPVNTSIRLQEALQNGISLNSFAYGTQNYLTLPEYKTDVIPSGTVTAWKNHMDIVKTILLNFINTNPDYFRKVSKTKYAVNENLYWMFYFIIKIKVLILSTFQVYLII